MERRQLGNKRRRGERRGDGRGTTWVEERRREKRGEERVNDMGREEKTGGERRRKRR